MAPYRQNDTLTNAGTSVTGKLQKEITKRSSALSSHKHTTKVRETNAPIVAKRPSKRRYIFLFSTFPSYSQEQGDTTKGTRNPHSRGTQCLNCIKFRRKQTSQAQLRRTCRSLPSPTTTTTSTTTTKRTSHNHAVFPRRTQGFVFFESAWKFH